MRMIKQASVLFFLALTVGTTQSWSVGNHHDSTACSDGSSRRAFLSSLAVAPVVATCLPSYALDAITKKTYELVQPDSLKDRVIVITGGNTGLGLESAKRLAAGGATLFLTTRSEQKGVAAVAAVQEYLSQKGLVNDRVSSVVLDLDDLESVKTFPSRLPASTQVDVLMNNAGVMAIPDRQLTKDGNERTFQSNHLGHFVLTAALFPKLANGAKVINVSSSAYNLGNNLDVNDLNSVAKEYQPWVAYGNSKLENILFTQELQRRADEAGVQLTAVSLHPGAVNTDLARYIAGEKKWNEYKERGPSTAVEKVFNNAIAAILKSVEDGASTQVFLAAGPVEKARFYIDGKPAKLPAFATDPLKAKALWEQSERISGVQFKLT